MQYLQPQIQIIYYQKRTYNINNSVLPSEDSVRDFGGNYVGNFMHIINAPNRRGINRCFCLTSVCLSDVCQSRSSGLRREQRGLGRPKLAQDSHVTRDSDTTLKVKRSKFKVTRPL